MNLEQMEYRCPDARVVGTVRLEDYRLAFCGRPAGNGVATIFPEEGSQVEGVLWEITPECEKSLDGYEGYPHLYGKQTVRVRNKAGMQMDVMAYVMNAPYKDTLASPSTLYLRWVQAEWNPGKTHPGRSEMDKKRSGKDKEAPQGSGKIRSG